MNNEEITTKDLGDDIIDPDILKKYNIPEIENIRDVLDYLKNLTNYEYEKLTDQIPNKPEFSNFNSIINYLESIENKDYLKLQKEAIKKYNPNILEEDLINKNYDKTMENLGILQIPVINNVFKFLENNITEENYKNINSEIKDKPEFYNLKDILCFLDGFGSHSLEKLQNIVANKIINKDHNNQYLREY